MIDPKLLFVLGAEKTGTSTLVGILNCHPLIFIMHEWFVDKEATRWGKYLFTFDLKSKKIYKRNNTKPAEIFFSMMGNQCNKFNNHNYKYFGDKWARLGSIRDIDIRIKEFDNIKTIFSIRDIREWAQHYKIVKMYKTSADTVPTICDYAYYYVSSFKLKNCIRIRLNDIVFDSSNVLTKISKFLGSDITKFEEHSKNWWNKIGIPKFGYNTFIKTTHKWWKIHSAAKAKTGKNHIDVILKNNDFWNEILPIFDKYYNNVDKKFEITEINKDLEKIINIKSRYQLSISDCYECVKFNNYK